MDDSDSREFVKNTDSAEHTTVSTLTRTATNTPSGTPAGAIRQSGNPAAVRHTSFAHIPEQTTKLIAWIERPCAPPRIQAAHL